MFTFRMVALTLLLALAALAGLAQTAYRVGAVTYLPLRTVTQQLGIAPDYDAKTKALTLRLPEGGPKVVLTVGSTAATVDDKPLVLDGAPFILSRVTYVPAGALLTALKLKAEVTERVLTMTVEHYGNEYHERLVVLPLTPERLALLQQTVTKEQRRAIFRAVALGKAAEVEKLVKATSALVVARNSANDMPLHAACRGGVKAVIETLLANGASLEDRGNDGGTPLHIACSPGTYSFSGDEADEEEEEEIDWEAMMEVERLAPLQVVTLLLAKGADPNAPDGDGESALFNACGPFKGDKAIAAALLAKGADPKARALDGRTPLHLAAHSGTTDVMALLLDKGADIHAKDAQGDTPLHEAAKWGKTAAVKVLTARKANVHAKNEEGETPFFLAAGSTLSNPETASALLHAGADINTRDGRGRTPLQALVEIQGTDDDEAALVKYLLDRGATFGGPGDETLHSACLGGNAKIIALLLGAKKADINGKNDWGDTPLHQAVKFQRVEVVRVLLANKANPNLKDDEGKTPLALAKAQGNKAIIDLLVKAGAK